MPTEGTCAGLWIFDIQEGEYENVNLAGTAALMLDANSTEEQREALAAIFTGKAGGDAAALGRPGR